MLVRSGSEPPVLCAAGSTEGFNSWSGDGKILKKKQRRARKAFPVVLLESLWQCLSFQLHSAVFYYLLLLVTYFSDRSKRGLLSTRAEELKPLHL